MHYAILNGCFRDLRERFCSEAPSANSLSTNWLSADPSKTEGMYRIECKRSTELLDKADCP